MEAEEKVEREEEQAAAASPSSAPTPHREHAFLLLVISWIASPLLREEIGDAFDERSLLAFSGNSFV